MKDFLSRMMLVSALALFLGGMFTVIFPNVPQLEVAETPVEWERYPVSTFTKVRLEGSLTETESQLPSLAHVGEVDLTATELEPISPMFDDVWDKRAYQHLGDYCTMNPGAANNGKVSLFFIICSSPAVPVCSLSLICSGQAGGACSVALICSGTGAGACSGGIVACSGVGAGACSGTIGVCSGTGAGACSGSIAACSGAAGAVCSGNVFNCSGGAAACSFNVAMCSGGAIACSLNGELCTGGAVVCSGNGALCSGAAVACSLSFEACSAVALACSASGDFCSGIAVMCSVNSNQCSGGAVFCSYSWGECSTITVACSASSGGCSASSLHCTGEAICRQVIPVEAPVGFNYLKPLKDAYGFKRFCRGLERSSLPDDIWLRLKEKKVGGSSEQTMVLQNLIDSGVNSFFHAS